MYLEDGSDSALSASDPAIAADGGRRSPPPPPPKRQPRATAAEIGAPTAAEHEAVRSFASAAADASQEFPGEPSLDLAQEASHAAPPASSPAHQLPPPFYGAQGSAPALQDAHGAPAPASSMLEPVATPPPWAAPHAAERGSQPVPRMAEVRPREVAAPERAARPVPAAGDPRRAKIFELQQEIHERLISHLDLRRMELEELASEELWAKTERAIADVVEALDNQGQIPSFVDQDALIKDVLNEALGLGPLEDLLADATVDEIMVNRADQVFVERSGRLTLTECGFSNDKAVLAVIERIIAPLGRRIDESSPLVDARLKDGSRVNAIIPPLSLKGPTLTIRKFRRDVLGAEDLVRTETLTPQMIDFLGTCVGARKNIVISGGTGSGKTTTLNVVSNAIPESERILTIEDAAELQLKHEHWIQLESRPQNIEGRGAITIRDLVRNSLRMRPDRIIVGECRGGEALDMLQAMNTGHDGSLTTAHSNGPRDTLSRLETMVLMAGMDLPIRAIREQIAAAIDLIVHQSRFPDGTRKITHITEVCGMEGDVITLQDIFVFKQEGFDARGRVLGRFVPSGFVPRFYEELQRRGVQLDMGVFQA
ncbi:MAG: Flp pilus assembly complex ATPase component TadA [Proteobacteria bacterium]|nr:Flp pilus assembly complex ATPase component TadA [Pseudomonadota bacterium]